MRVSARWLGLATLAVALAVAPMAHAGSWTVQQNGNNWVVANGSLKSPGTTKIDTGSDKKAADALAKDLNKAQDKGARDDAKDAKKGK
jgi:hypothetical protein